MGITLRSERFVDGGRIPMQFIFEDRSPPLTWFDVPSGTRSFALFCEDLDAGSEHAYHWAICDIPKHKRAIAENYPHHPRAGGTHQAVNDFGHIGYDGRCPDEGPEEHHYQFKLLALDVDHLDLPEAATARDIERAARGHVLGHSELVGTHWHWR